MGAKSPLAYRLMQSATVEPFLAAPYLGRKALVDETLPLEDQSTYQEPQALPRYFLGALRESSHILHSLQP